MVLVDVMDGYRELGFDVGLLGILRGKLTFGTFVYSFLQIGLFIIIEYCELFSIVNLAPVLVILDIFRIFRFQSILL